MTCSEPPPSALQNLPGTDRVMICPTLSDNRKDLGIKRVTPASPTSVQHLSHRTLQVVACTGGSCLQFSKGNLLPATGHQRLSHLADGPPGRLPGGAPCTPLSAGDEAGPLCLGSCLLLQLSRRLQLRGHKAAQLCQRWGDAACFGCSLQQGSQTAILIQVHPRLFARCMLQPAAQRPQCCSICGQNRLWLQRCLLSTAPELHSSGLFENSACNTTSCHEAAHQLLLSLCHCRSHTLVALMGQDPLKGPKRQRHRGGRLHPCIPGDSSF